MLAQKKVLAQTKILLLSAIAISLAACSSGTETTTIPSATTTSTTPTSSQATNSTANITIPGVKNISEVNFITEGKNSPGFFDAVNGSTSATVEVPRATPITVGGWAILPNAGKPADRVIVTYGENNTVAAVTPVNVERPDVAKTLNNPAYQNSGWNAIVNSSTLPSDKVVLKAWAYNAESKEAFQLNRTPELVLTN